MNPSRRPRIALLCPRCGAEMAEIDPGIQCDACGFSIPTFGGVLDLLADADRDPEASRVEKFYERNPFPGYGANDNAESLLDRCRRSPFLDALERSIPVDASVLDCGCGTGQLASFLALASAAREVWATDSSRGPLLELDRFRARAGIPNLQALRADLFELPFAHGSFDVVSSRGVIHHTPEPFDALQRIATLVRPGGHLVLAWYESYGRAAHHLRQALAGIRGRPIDRLDPILRDPLLDPTKRQAWIEDQYHHPLEQDLALPEVASAVSEAGLRWIRTVPPAPPRGRLFTPTPRPTGLALWFRRLGWALRGIHEPDAGLVSLVARRPGEG